VQSPDTQADSGGTPASTTTNTSKTAKSTTTGSAAGDSVVGKTTRAKEQTLLDPPLPSAGNDSMDDVLFIQVSNVN